MIDVQIVGMGLESALADPAWGVKYHVPHRSYMQYRGRKQLPRDYYSRR